MAFALLEVLAFAQVGGSAALAVMRLEVHAKAIIACSGLEDRCCNAGELDFWSVGA